MRRSKRCGLCQWKQCNPIHPSLPPSPSHSLLHGLHVSNNTAGSACHVTASETEVRGLRKCQSTPTKYGIKCLDMSDSRIRHCVWMSFADCLVYFFVVFFITISLFAYLFFIVLYFLFLVYSMYECTALPFGLITNNNFLFPL